VLDEIRQQKGFVIHTNGPVPDGWRVVEVWDSQADFEAWFEAYVKPAFPEGAPNHDWSSRSARDRSSHRETTLPREPRPHIPSPARARVAPAVLKPLEYQWHPRFEDDGRCAVLQNATRRLRPADQPPVTTRAAC
jgi:hypothetical protein